MTMKGQVPMFPRVLMATTVMTFCCSALLASDLGDRAGAWARLMPATSEALPMMLKPPTPDRAGIQDMRGDR